MRLLQLAVKEMFYCTFVTDSIFHRIFYQGSETAEVFPALRLLQISASRLVGVVVVSVVAAAVSESIE